MALWIFPAYLLNNELSNQEAHSLLDPINNLDISFLVNVLDSTKVVFPKTRFTSVGLSAEHLVANVGLY